MNETDKVAHSQVNSFEPWDNLKEITILSFWETQGSACKARQMLEQQAEQV